MMAAIRLFLILSSWNFLQGIGLSPPKTAHFSCSDYPAILHGFPDITHIEVNNGHKSAIFNFMELTFLRAYPSLKSHILFYSNGLAI